jgi:hypothetical protein
MEFAVMAITIGGSMFVGWVARSMSFAIFDKEIRPYIANVIASMKIDPSGWDYIVTPVGESISPMFFDTTCVTKYSYSHVHKDHDICIDCDIHGNVIGISRPFIMHLNNSEKCALKSAITTMYTDLLDTKTTETLLLSASMSIP